MYEKADDMIFYFFHKIDFFEKFVTEKIDCCFFVLFSPKHVVLIQKAFGYVLNLTLLGLPAVTMLSTGLKV